MRTDVETEVVVKKAKGKRSSMTLEWESDDPNAELIWRGIGLMLKEFLTPEQARDFLREFKAQLPPKD